MKKDSKVKAWIGDKYVPGIVKDIEDAHGFGKHGGETGYQYKKVWVEFLDESVKIIRDYDLIEVVDEEKKEKVAKSK